MQILKKKTRFLRLVNVNRSNQLSPRAHKFYKVARNLKTIARRLDFENANIKKRLKSVQEICTSEEYLKSKVNKDLRIIEICFLRDFNIIIIIIFVTGE